MTDMIEHMKNGLVYILQDQNYDDCVLHDLDLTEFQTTNDGYHAKFVSGEYAFFCNTMNENTPLHVHATKYFDGYIVSPGAGEDAQNQSIMHQLYSPILKHYLFAEHELPDYLDADTANQLEEWVDVMTELVGEMHEVGEKHRNKVLELNKEAVDGESDSEG